MNGSTSVDFGERGARDGICEYCQDLDVSASEELTKVCGGVERRSAEKVPMSSRSSVDPKIYLRLEPLGLELVAAAARKEGHDVQIIDLQAETQRDYFRVIDRWQPDAVAYSCNYLANVPEIIDLAKETRDRLPDSLIMVGG